MPNPYLIELTGQVGSATFNAQDVRKALNGAAGRPVDIMIDSCGGLLSEGLSISGAVRDHGQVTAHLRGLVASAATIASMGAARISIAPESLYLVHKVSLGFIDWASRNADQLDRFIQELQHTKENLDAMDRAIAEVYARRCKKPVKDLLELMKGERWLSASETLEWGFVDEIQEQQSQGNSDPSDNEPNASGLQPKASTISITAAQAAAITAAGLPMPPVEILSQPSGNIFTKLANQISQFLSNLMNPNQQNPNPSGLQPNPSGLQPNASTLHSQPSTHENPPSQPAQNTLSVDPAAAPAGSGATNNASTLHSQPSTPQSPDNRDDEINRLKAEIAALKAQNAAAPGASTNEVKTSSGLQPNASVLTPKTPYEAYIRTSQSAQALFNSIP